MVGTLFSIICFDATFSQRRAIIDDMLALSKNLETRSGQSTHGVLMIDTWYPGHELNRDVDFTDILTPSLVFEGGHILADGVSDVLERLLFSLPLAPATRSAGDRDADALVGGVEEDLVSHSYLEIGPPSTTTVIRGSALPGHHPRFLKNRFQNVVDGESSHVQGAVFRYPRHVAQQFLGVH